MSKHQWIMPVVIKASAHIEEGNSQTEECSWANQTRFNVTSGLGKVEWFECVPHEIFVPRLTPSSFRSFQDARLCLDIRSLRRGAGRGKLGIRGTFYTPVMLRWLHLYHMTHFSVCNLMTWDSSPAETSLELQPQLRHKSCATDTIQS